MSGLKGQKLPEAVRLFLARRPGGGGGGCATEKRKKKVLCTLSPKVLRFLFGNFLLLVTAADHEQLSHNKDTSADTL